MNTTAISISIVAAGAIVAGAVLYSTGILDRFFERSYVTALRAEFVDPDSVQIRGAFKNGPHWCGEVNARNRMGGYTGWQRFAALHWPVSLPSRAEFDEAIERIQRGDTARTPSIEYGWRIELESTMGKDFFERLIYNIYCVD